MSSMEMTCEYSTEIIVAEEVIPLSWRRDFECRFHLNWRTL